ncbi:hypothetical protein DFP97_10481 [Paenibacillus prosopidis]|uniref:Uncharacterized protein n=1 Tax=Paenibacillus prosopidis TaxID=630520 RepID=A0A368W3L4_9BACL|nr:hypothetical protein DFP97_10481 [Paenibacillus prosopidis]
MNIKIGTADSLRVGSFLIIFTLMFSIFLFISPLMAGPVENKILADPLTPSLINSLIAEPKKNREPLGAP